MRTAPRSAVAVSVALLASFAWGQNAPGPAQLPAGNGHDLAAARCTSCHDAGRLAIPGYTRDGWQSVIGRMVKLGAAVAPD